MIVDQEECRAADTDTDNRTHRGCHRNSGRIRLDADDSEAPQPQTLYSQPETTTEETSSARREKQPLWITHPGAVLSMAGAVVAAAIVASMSFAGILASNWQQERAGHQQYQSDLVLRALEPDETEEREELLEFLLQTQLLTDEEIRKGLTAYLEGPNELPQFGRLACHPSYEPCVPNVSDVDCAGGASDGPAYTGQVTVIGPDVYDLDTDGDGIGCESTT